MRRDYTMSVETQKRIGECQSAALAKSAKAATGTPSERIDTSHCK
ncbi:hypothetical protein SAMN03159363_3420 [Variovorax sp. EL159]|nr:hypothetical protein SAMN03159363_3420 [Variovorax sp. EL159]